MEQIQALDAQLGAPQQPAGAESASAGPLCESQNGLACLQFFKSASAGQIALELDQSLPTTS